MYPNSLGTFQSEFECYWIVTIWEKSSLEFYGQQNIHYVVFISKCFPLFFCFFRPGSCQIRSFTYVFPWGGDVVVPTSWCSFRVNKLHNFFRHLGSWLYFGRNAQRSSLFPRGQRYLRSGKGPFIYYVSILGHFGIHPTSLRSLLYTWLF